LPRRAVASVDADGELRSRHRAGRARAGWGFRQRFEQDEEIARATLPRTLAIRTRCDRRTREGEQIDVLVHKDRLMFFAGSGKAISAGWQ
jgi:hypothetical protein